MKKKFLFLFFLSLAWTTLFSEDLVQDSFVLEYNKNYTEALDILEKACKQNPHDYLAHLRAAWMAYLTGQMEKSLGYYHKAVVLFPGAIEPHLGKLLPLVSMKKYKEIQIAAKTILRMDGKNYIARKNMAFALYMMQDYESAYKYYFELIKDYPADVEILIGLGWTYLRLGEKKKANYVFLGAYRILPADTRVISGLKASKLP